MGNSKLARQHFIQGKNFLKQQNYFQAQNSFRKSIEQKKDYSIAYYNLAIVLDRQMKYKQAVIQYQNYIKLCPDDPEAYYNVALTFRKIKNQVQAIKSYKKAIQINPKYAQAHYNLAVVYDDQQKFQEAINQLKKTIEITPEDSDAWYNLGISLRNICNYEEALVSFQKAIALRQDYVEAYYNMGVCYDDLGCYEKAQNAYMKALKYNPNYSDAQHNLGIALDHQGKTEQATKAYEKAIQISPTNILYHANFGNFFLKINQIKKASSCFYQIDKIFQLPQSKQDNFLSAQNIQVSLINHVFSSMRIFRSTYGELQKLEEQYKNNSEAIAVIQQHRASIIVPISKLFDQDEQQKTEAQQKQDCVKAQIDIYKMLKDLQQKLRSQFRAEMKIKEAQIKKLSEKVKSIQQKMVTKDQIQNLQEKMHKYGEQAKQIKQQLKKLKERYLPDENLKAKIDELKQQNRMKIVKYSQNLYWMLNTSVAAYRMLKMKLVQKGQKNAKGRVGWFVSKIAKVLSITEHIPVVGDLCQLILSVTQNYCGHSEQTIIQKICQMFSQQWNQRQVSNLISQVVLKIISDGFYCQIIQKFQSQNTFLNRICFVLQKCTQKSIRMIEGIQMQKQENNSRMALADCTYIICTMVYINTEKTITKQQETTPTFTQGNKIMLITVDKLIEERQKELLKV